MRAAIAIAKACSAHGVPWCLEHPFTSLAWRTAQLQTLLRQSDTNFARVDFCAFGTPWRKRTGLLFGGGADHADVDRLSEFACTGKTACTFSGKPHVQLIGYDPVRGGHRTQLAEPYPTKLCKCITNILTGRLIDARCAESGF